MTKKKLIPKDVFKNEIKEGMKIVYITVIHSAITLNYAEVLDIKWKDDKHYTYIPYKIKVKKYAQKGRWDDDTGKWPMEVFLTNPLCLIVGKDIMDHPDLIEEKKKIEYYNSRP